MAKVEGRLGTGAVWKKLKWIAVSPARTFRAQTVPSACFRTGTQGIRQVCDAEQSLHRQLSGYIQGLQLTGLRRSRDELVRRIPAVRPDQRRPSLLKLDSHLDRRVMAGTSPGCWQKAATRVCSRRARVKFLSAPKSPERHLPPYRVSDRAFQLGMAEQQLNSPQVQLTDRLRPDTERQANGRSGRPRD